MTTRSTYDPFGWRLEELARPDVNPLRRAELLDDLLIAEAEELAAGRRHFTIVHGEPTDVAEVEDLNDFYDAVGAIVSVAEWSRLTGRYDRLTATVAGTRSAGCVNRLIDLVRQLAGGQWQVVEAPYVRDERI